MKNRHEVTGDTVTAGGLPNDGLPGNPNSGTSPVHPAPAPEAEVGETDPSAPKSPSADRPTKTDAEKEVGGGDAA